MLTEAEEQLIVEMNVTGNSAWERLFTQLMGATRYEYEGEQITQSEILAKLHDADRDARRTAADSITGTLTDKSMELTYIFNVLGADKAAQDRRRGYPTWVSSRNLANKASDETVDALITAVVENYDIVAQHYNLKRRLLGYDELYEYDRYAPLPIENADKPYSWEQAQAVVSKAYHAFTPRLGEIADRFFEENWIHAMLAPGKRGGAFAAPTVPSAHPFVFLNFTGQARDVMTLAHELGHGVHMYLTAEQQGGVIGSSTPLTTSEMASVFGEGLVFEDMMRNEPDAAVRLAMLSQKIEDTFATVFRQISMNRFEDAFHTARRTEGELTTERISELWMDTQRAMFGGSVSLRDEYSQWWSYIPHFIHTPGYVYAYSFGELLVLALFNLYKTRGDAFIPQYLEVLSAGDSNYPENILGKVGVDLTAPAFWNEGLQAIRDLVEQEEALVREVFPDKA
jgi:oligoendopeptidase F